uniref:Uncharacterized protein n=1 Tax=Arundo donax TaxID=35708 RepID=A0A0A9DPH1_ARUDO
MEHSPVEHFGASSMRKYGHLSNAIPPDTKDQEIKPVRLGALRLAVDVAAAVTHGEVPLARAVAERLAVPRPPLPRRHLPLRRPDVAGAEHLAAEPDALQDAEVARVHGQVLQHLVMARGPIGRGDVHRPREV